MKIIIIKTLFLIAGCCLTITKSMSQDQNGMVTGVVSSNEGPLYGVNVTAENGNAKTVTNEKGAYTINVGQDDFLVFTMVGYVTQRIKVDGNIVDATLQPVSGVLDEVVVVGYGTQKRSSVTGAVSSVSSAELGKSAVPNSANLLQGRLPGLEVIQSTGRPGNDEPLIRVRGMGSFGASSNPLILIDGVQGSLSSISPHDIESVTVLKDAASASIYGARAANGVVLVTSKKGKAGSSALDYNYNLGIQNATSVLDLIWDSAEYMELYNQARERAGKPPVYTQQQIDDYRFATDRTKYPNFNWPDYIFKTGIAHDHALSFSKATETNKFRIGLSYYDQGGVLPVFESKRYTANLNYENQVSNKVKVGTIVNFLNVNSVEPQGNSAIDLMRAIYNRSPLAMPYLPDGRKSSGRAYSSEDFSVWAPTAFTNGNRIGNTYAAKAQLMLSYDILENLTWETTGSFSLNYLFNKSHGYSTVGEYYFYQTVPGEDDYRMDQSVGQPVYLGVSDFHSTSLTPMLYSTLKYHVDIANHKVDAMIGYEQQTNNYREISGARQTFPSPLLEELNAGSPTGQSLAGTANSWALQSFFARVGYNFLNKYLIEGNVRYDGTSRVHANNRWGIFPSVSAGWMLSEENFLKRDWMNSLKLRTSVGLLGNQEIGLYPYQDIFAASNYSYGSGVEQGVAMGRMTDKNLQWEKTRVVDIGLDGEFFDGLVGFEIDVYKKNTYDILTTLPVPGALGLTGPITNDGKLENTGIEVGLTHRNAIGKLYYDVSLQYAANKNKVTSILTPTIGVVEVGLPYNSYYIYEWTGIFQSQEEIENSPKQNNNPKPGDLKIKDQNNDGVVDADDRVSYSRFPKANYSMNLNVAWKNFGLSVFLQAVQGAKANLNAGNWTSFPFREGIPPGVEFRNAWTPDNPSNTVPAIHDYSYIGVYGYASTYLLRSSSYLRLKNVYLSYTLPENFLSHSIGLKGLTVFGSGNNLLTFTKFKDGDPERLEGTDLPQYPQVRSFNFGLNVKF